MAVLKVASNANAALTLPAILAAAYVTHQGGEVDITFEGVDGRQLQYRAQKHREWNCLSVFPRALRIPPHWAR